MKIREVQEQIRALKKQGRVITNIVPGCVQDDTELLLKQTDQSVLFWCKERFRENAYYATVDEEDLIGLMGELPGGTVVEQLYRNEGENPQENLVGRAGFQKLATFIRVTTMFISNPYEVPEVGRRAILNDYYDPAFGEYATEADAEELYRIHRETFDERIDDVFTKTEWENILAKRECMVARENGRIVTYYVFRAEGVKLYGHISVNRGPANYLYNIERRVFTEAWEKGVRGIYAWYDMKNTKARIRVNKAAAHTMKEQSFLYNDIFIKEKTS